MTAPANRTVYLVCEVDEGPFAAYEDVGEAIAALEELAEQQELAGPYATQPDEQGGYLFTGGDGCLLFTVKAITLHRNWCPTVHSR